jgi:hypothetical protein
VRMYLGLSTTFQFWMKKNDQAEAVFAVRF